LLCGITAVPPDAEIHKTALGAENSVQWQYFKDTKEAVMALQADNYTVLAIEQVKGSIMLDNLILDKAKKYAVVLGNEVKGVQQEVVDISFNKQEIKYVINNLSICNLFEDERITIFINNC